MSNLPDGIELAYTHWGEPKSDTAMQLVSTDTAPAQGSYTKYRARAAEREKKCKANDDTCNGWRMVNGDFCPMHAGVVRPKGK